jgi:type IV secretory pathway VirB9-like protein
VNRLIIVALSLMLVAGITNARQGAASPAKSDLAQDSRSRRVSYGEEDVIAVRAKIRFTTLVILPNEESILDFTCGDREFWVVNGSHNLAYIKPAKEGSETNLNLVTASGNVYSFVLREVSAERDAVPDLKIFVEPREQSVIAAINREPKFVPAEEVANYRDQVALLKEEARESKIQAEKSADARLDKFFAEYPQNLRMDYRFAAEVEPFMVSSIWNDGRFTYIRAHPRELPALYEINGRKPNLINFDCRDGTFIVSKVIDSGYLAIGKAHLHFARKER